MLSIIFNTSDFLAHVALIIEEENMKKYENTYQVWYGLLINYTCITLIYFQNIAINPTLFCKNSFCEGFLLDVTWLQGFAPIDSEVRHWCWAMRTGTQSAFQFPSKVFSWVQVLASSTSDSANHSLCTLCMVTFSFWNKKGLPQTVATKLEAHNCCIATTGIYI